MYKSFHSPSFQSYFSNFLSHWSPRVLFRTMTCEQLSPSPTAPFKVTPAKIHPEILKVATSYPSHIHIPVQWGDQDAFGHLNNVIYFRYFETARLEYITGMSHHLPKDRRSAMVRPSKNDPAPIVAQINTRFHAQVHFPDTLTYFTKLSELDVQERLYDPACDRITMEYVAYSNKLGIKVASGSCLVVCFDYGKNCKLPYPLFLRKAFHAYECEPENSLANKEKVPEI